MKCVKMSLRLILIFLVLVLFHHNAVLEAIEIGELRKLAAKNNVSCILVFGDSSVDPGNNNHLSTLNKANYLPYGLDLSNSQPTGRFSNGKLATDFIAEALGYVNMTRGFLDPQINNMDMLHGISFASAGSGYDDLTANLSNAMSLAKQREYLRHYEIQLRQMVGAEKASEVMKNALYILSMGTNDFLQNYFVEVVRSKQYSVEQYQNFLIHSMFTHVKDLIHGVGARRLAVVGVPPLGCEPLIRTIRDDETKCDDDLNKVAFSFNLKLKRELQTLKRLFGIKASFIDIYSIIQEAVQNPHKFGFEETRNGCCGTGTTEYGETCKGLSTCADRTKFVFWDAVHPSEKMHKIMADEALKAINADLLS
ncbi:GDSL esterase/lipase At5g45950-like isoform X1 [Nicotiana tabacum]|uniref:GDSL esterase/lipase At5g45950-like isoform X1 n=1 Tax=Nicotiana tabacum TaxID=4097 RepID=A0A1S4A1X3_TOBAC|nr:PREDICTED: GDSL esterase/lipase At5g45950-like isoform X1 [Nicotiana tabacum]